jgi:hypothetical protein
MHISLAFLLVITFGLSADVFACRSPYKSLVERQVAANTAIEAWVTSVAIPELETPMFHEHPHASILALELKRSLRLSVIKTVKGPAQPSIISASFSECNSALGIEVGRKIYALRIGDVWRIEDVELLPNEGVKQMDGSSGYFRKPQRKRIAK